MTDMTTSTCCAPATQATCCEPAAKPACCTTSAVSGARTGDDRCGCAAGPVGPAAAARRIDQDVEPVD